MRPMLMIEVRGGRMVAAFFKTLLVLALAVLGVYIFYGLLYAILAGTLALVILVLIGRVLLRLLRGGGA
jgi:hypothetical protein